MVHQSDMVQHQSRGEQQRCRIGKALAGDIGSRSVYRFEDRRFLTDVGTGRGAQTAHQPGDQVRQYVPEQIGGHDHIELPGVQHKLHGTGVDDPLIAFDAPGIFASDLLPGFKENASQRLQHIGLVHQSNLLAPKLHCVLERVPDDPPGPVPCVHARGNRHRVRVVADRDVMLEGNVQAFKVLADQDQVNILEAPAGNQRVRRSQIGIELELLP